MEKLLTHHINETKEEFKGVREQIKEMRVEVKEQVGEMRQELIMLREHRISAMNDAKWVSVIVSAVCGLLIIIVTSVIQIYKK